MPRKSYTRAMKAAMIRSKELRRKKGKPPFALGRLAPSAFSLRLRKIPRTAGTEVKVRPGETVEHALKIFKRKGRMP